MREFIDSIFAIIGVASLNDEEFEMITIDVQAYTKALYDELIIVLDSREMVSSARDRLTLFFKSAGVTLTEPTAARSNIFLGEPL